MRKTITAAYALILLAGAQPSFAADDAALNFTKALSAACQPWMEGADRKTLGATLKADGWDVTADVIFVKNGAWGRVQATLQEPKSEAKPAADNWMKQWVDKTYGTQQPPAAKPKRECTISVNTNEDPWSTESASAAFATWITSAYPTAVKTSTGTVIVEARTLDAVAWSADDLRLTQAAQRSKQTEPTFDLLFLVKRQ